MDIREIARKAESGESFQVRPEEMPEYIRYLYTTHRCVHDFLGIAVDEARRGEIWLSMPVRADYTNSGGFLYGGILAAMADAMSLGLIAGVGKSAVTTNLSINFVRPHPIGDGFACTGRSVITEGGCLRFAERSAAKRENSLPIWTLP